MPDKTPLRDKKSLGICFILALLISMYALFGLEKKTQQMDPYFQPDHTNRFDLNPNTVILSIDIHYPGIPRPTRNATDRYCTFVPEFYIWGDGLAYYTQSLILEPDKIFSGVLQNNTLIELSDAIQQDRISTPAHGTLAPNPSGVMINIGLKQLEQPAMELSNDFNANLWRQVSRIQNDLASNPSHNILDPRITALLKKYENCNRY